MNILDMPRDVLGEIVGLSENPGAIECSCRALRAASLAEGVVHRRVGMRGPTGRQLRSFLETHDARQLDLDFADEDAVTECLQYVSCFATSTVRTLSMRYPVGDATQRWVSTLTRISTTFPGLRTLALYVSGVKTPEYVVVPQAPAFEHLEKLVMLLRDIGPRGSCEFILGRRLPSLTKHGVFYM